MARGSAIQSRRSRRRGAGGANAGQDVLHNDLASALQYDVATSPSSPNGEKVVHCALGLPSASYRHAVCTRAGSSEVSWPPIHTRVPGGGMRESWCRYSHCRVLSGIQPSSGHGLSLVMPVPRLQTAIVTCPDARMIFGARRGRGARQDVSLYVHSWRSWSCSGRHGNMRPIEASGMISDASSKRPQ